MNSKLGPWTTGLDSSTAQLSRLWKQRVLALSRSSFNARRMSAPTLGVLSLIGGLAVTLPQFVGIAGPPDAAIDHTIEAVAATPRNEASAGAPVRVELPGGAVAEILAIGPHPSQDQTWWAPDGDPAPAPYAEFKSKVSPGEGFFVREIAVRWLEQPAGLMLGYHVVGGGSAASGNPIAANGSADRKLCATAQAFPDGTKTAALRFYVGLGEWEVVGASDGTADFSMGNGKYSIAFTRVSHRPEGLAISAAHNITGQDVRLVAIDRQDKLTSAPYVSSGGGRGFMQTTGAFPRLELADVKEFRLETRPMRFVEVRNLSLAPGEHTQPEVVVLPADADD